MRIKPKYGPLIRSSGWDAIDLDSQWELNPGLSMGLDQASLGWDVFDLDSHEVVT
jgi:hypothetical protein